MRKRLGTHTITEEKKRTEDANARWLERDQRKKKRMINHPFKDPVMRLPYYYIDNRIRRQDYTE